MLRIALTYGALLAAIVVAADTGWLPHFAERLHDLPFGDKVIHFTLFGLLALAANLALASRGKRSLARAIVLGSIFVVVIATAEEYSNLFVSRRDWSLGDLTANYLGVACLGLLPLWRPQLFRRSTDDENDSAGPHEPPSR
jgi:polysaccharide biosynthesis protein VpsQ